MTLKWRAQAVLVKIETTEGVDAGPTGAANAILALNGELTPFAADTVSRDVLQPYLGASEDIPVGVHVVDAFDVEIAGSGAAGTAPAYDPLLRACGLSPAATTGTATVQASPATEVGTPIGDFTYGVAAGFTGIEPRTVTLTCTTGGSSGVAQFTVAAPAAGNLAAYNQTGVVMTTASPFALGGGAVITPTVGTSFEIGDQFTIAVTAPRVVYSPVSDGFESVTVYHSIETNRHPMTGARGTMTLQMTPKALPKMRFALTGRWVDPGDAALPDVDFSAFQAPRPVSSAATPVADLGGYQGVVRDFSIDLGNTVVHQDFINKESVELTDRNVKGTLVLDAPALATKDYFATVLARTKQTLRVVHGTAPGGIVQIDAPSIQLLNPRYGNADGNVTLTLDLKFLPVAGNDEIAITIK